jgi:hypothetical protein
VGVGDTGDEAVEAEAAQVVGHLPGGHGLGGGTELVGYEGPEVSVGEPVGTEHELGDGCHEGEDAAVTETQGGDALPVDRRLMRQVGGGFRFRHNLIRDASLSSTQSV